MLEALVERFGSNRCAHTISIGVLFFALWIIRAIIYPPHVDHGDFAGTVHMRHRYSSH